MWVRGIVGVACEFGLSLCPGLTGVIITIITCCVLVVRRALCTSHFFTVVNAPTVVILQVGKLGLRKLE